MWQLTNDRRGFRPKLLKKWSKQLTAFGVEFHKMGDEFSTIELCQVPSCGRNKGGSAFYKGPWSVFSENPGPGPVYKVCPSRLWSCNHSHKKTIVKQLIQVYRSSPLRNSSD